MRGTKKTFTRLLSILLVVCMMIGFAVTGSAAASTYKVVSFEALKTGSNFKFDYTNSAGTSLKHNDNPIPLSFI